MIHRRILFVDIDGVLNSVDSAERFQTFEVLDPTAVQLLRVVTERNEAEIVITSTWRLWANWLALIRRSFSEAGWENPPIIGRTPELRGVRGSEIAVWLAQNPTDSFIIIDDDTDMLPEQMNSLVSCDPQHGFGEREVGEIDRIWERTSFEPNTRT